MIDSNLLQKEMRKNGYTMDTLASEMNITRTGLFNKIHNKSEFKVSEIVAISALFNLSLEQKEAIFFAKVVECNST